MLEELGQVSPTLVMMKMRIHAHCSLFVPILYTQPERIIIMMPPIETQTNYTLYFIIHIQKINNGREFHNQLV